MIQCFNYFIIVHTFTNLTGYKMCSLHISSNGKSMLFDNELLLEKDNSWHIFPRMIQIITFACLSVRTIIPSIRYRVRI
jgi:hypothetical protein